MPVEHFKDPESYRKYRAYVHIHGIPTHAREVVVGGKRHKVKHSKSSRSKPRGSRMRKASRGRGRNRSRGRSRD